MIAAQTLQDRHACPYTLRVPDGRGRYLRFPCALDALHDDLHQAEVPGAKTEASLTQGLHATEGPVRIYWAHPM